MLSSSVEFTSMKWNRDVSNRVPDMFFCRVVQLSYSHVQTTKRRLQRERFPVVRNIDPTRETNSCENWMEEN